MKFCNYNLKNAPVRQHRSSQYSSPERYCTYDIYIVSFRGRKVKAPGIFMPKTQRSDTMKIEKLPSGSYRVRKMYQGNAYSIVFDHKPTQKEAFQAISAELDRIRTKYDRLTFLTAAAEYVETKRNVLSPRSIKEYIDMYKRLPKWFQNRPLADITQIDINRVVNDLSANRAPKTVRNYHALISAILGTFRPDMKIFTKLPQKVKNEPYIPSQHEIKAILETATGTKYEAALWLGCYGLRRSEICALTLEDIDGDVVHITKAMVMNDRHEWVIKVNKTTDSTRDIVIPAELADKIREQGFVYEGHPNGISKYLAKVERQLGIPNFSLHKLRHYFASEMSALGVPEADILKLGGWKSDHVMKTVYRHSMMDREEEAKRDAAEKLRSAIFS